MLNENEIPEIEDTPTDPPKVEAVKAVEPAPPKVEVVEPKPEEADEAKETATKATEATAALKMDLKVAKAEITNLKKKGTALDDQVAKLQATIKDRNDADLARLTDEQKAVVMDFADDKDDPAKVARAISKCIKHKLFDVPAHVPPKADKTRTASGKGGSTAGMSFDEIDAKTGINTGRR